MASLCCFRMMHYYYCLWFKRAVNITTITLSNCTFLELLRYCDAVNSVQGFYRFQDIFWTQFKIFFSNLHERNCCFHEDFSSIPRTTYLSNSKSTYVHMYIISRHVIWYLHSCPKQLLDLKMTIKIAKLWNSPNQYCR